MFERQKICTRQSGQLQFEFCLNNAFLFILNSERNWEQALINVENDHYIIM